MTKWIKYPENIPTEDGYYMTEYFNVDLNEYFGKGIFWNSTKQSWIGWRPDGGPGLTRVKSFMPESRHDYYIP